MRVLFVLPGLVPPPEDPRRDRLFHLSEVASGEALLPVWWRSAPEAPPFLRPTFPVHRVGAFGYHLHLAYRWPAWLRTPAALLFYVRKGWRLHREQRLDLIVAYGVNATGVAAVLLKWATGAKLAVEIPGVPEDAFLFDGPARGPAASLKHRVTDRLLSFVGANADCMKLLYPEQLSSYPIARRRPAAVFHDFVPVSLVPEGTPATPFILSVGYPWYTKGMDLLVRAFRLIGPSFPGWRLRLMGYFPDRSALEGLAGGCPQIEFLDPRPNEAALEVIATCSVFALASRTEAMGRVLLEAMAARKPIVASRVGGVPHYVTHGVNGLLFEAGNVPELAGRLSHLLASEALRRRLGDEAYRLAHSDLDERSYVRAFGDMVRTLGPIRPRRVGVAGV